MLNFKGPLMDSERAWNETFKYADLQICKFCRTNFSIFLPVLILQYFNWFYIYTLLESWGLNFLHFDIFLKQIYLYYLENFISFTGFLKVWPSIIWNYPCEKKSYLKRGNAALVDEHGLILSKKRERWEPTTKELFLDSTMREVDKQEILIWNRGGGDEIVVDNLRRWNKNWGKK